MLSHSEHWLVKQLKKENKSTADLRNVSYQLVSLADRTNALMLQCCVRPSVVVVCLYVICTECIVAKRCVLEQKLLLTSYRKSCMRNRLVPKWMILTFV